jgi:hypothetical protein
VSASSRSAPSSWPGLRRYLLLWPGRTRRFSLAAALAGAGAVFLIVVALFAIGSWIAPIDAVDGSCSDNAFACGTLTELIATALALAVAVAFFLYWRVFRVAHRYLAEGMEDPTELVPTAAPMGKVVGRDAICEIIEADLRREDRRPQVIVGGVGEGKTAVLVKLTELLIESRAVPVCVRMRDARIPLNFTELAKSRFIERVGDFVSGDEAEKVWRKLCSDHRVVVLADGLEEALHDEPERLPEIRRAVKEAIDDHLPLVITSRPDEALRMLDGAVIRLEPLSDSDAIEYIRDDGGELPLELEHLVEVAQVTESPLYLQLASKLSDAQLRSMSIDQGRLAARVELLEGWRQSLLAGAEGAHVHPKHREAAFEGLEWLACIALRDNTLQLRLSDLADEPRVDGDDYDKAKLAASVGEDLRLVERVPDGVRFRHSVMEAYLGGRAIPSVARDPLPDRLKRRVRRRGARKSYLDCALENPSRELLMALAVASFRNRHTGLPLRVERRLRAAARNLSGSNPVAYDALAAAYEVDRLTGPRATVTLGDTAEKLWETAGALDPLGDPLLNEAKMRAIARMEEVRAEATYGALWTICRAEDAYRVRLRAAQGLAEGGVKAHAVLEQPIEDALRVGRRLRRGRAGNPGPGEVRFCSLMGWILPTLASTCVLEEPQRVPSITGALEKMVVLSRDGLHLGVEACLAQGFKFEANRLPHRTTAYTRAQLVRLARELLDASRWWYSQMSLLQALALWSLATDSAERSTLRKVVSDWTSDGHHPLVREAARLCGMAIDQAGERDGGSAPVEPSRYLWIDEAGVVAKIGGRTVRPDPRSTAGLWVSPAAGWSTLEPAARWLVGDVFLYLNLIEGGEAPPRDDVGPKAWSARRAAWREQRRQRVLDQGATLPRCLTAPDWHERLCLKRERTTPEERARPPRSDCCPFGLCPYPALDEQPFRGEPRETFCREHMRLARDEGPAAWYEAGRRLPGRRSGKDELSDFWTAMEGRAKRTSTLLLSED